MRAVEAEPTSPAYPDAGRRRADPSNRTRPMCCGSDRNAITLGLDSYQYVDNSKAMNRTALITGATRNLGFSLAEGLAQRLEPTDTVYLTGRDPARIAESVHRLSNARAEVRGEVLDVARPEAGERCPGLVVSRPGGGDVVL